MALQWRNSICYPPERLPVNNEFRIQGWLGIESWLIISVDHGGNPIGFAPDGQIWISDHDFGVVKPIAQDFEDFIHNYCFRF
jgi:hypothetical protein